MSFRCGNINVLIFPSTDCRLCGVKTQTYGDHSDSLRIREPTRRLVLVFSQTCTKHHSRFLWHGKFVLMFFSIELLLAVVDVTASGKLRFFTLGIQGPK